MAIIWQGEPEDEVKKITYAELQAEVCKFANVLKSLGIQKGDRVAIYMPMIPEAAVAMLGCARIGADSFRGVRRVQLDSLAGRIIDSECKLLDDGQRLAAGGKSIALKALADEALNTRPASSRSSWSSATPSLQHRAGRDVWYHELMAAAVAGLPAARK